MKLKLIKSNIWICILLLSFSTSFSAPKNELTMRFLKALNIKSNSKITKSLPGDTQITPLFIRSEKKGKIDLTMLIACDNRLSKQAQHIIKKAITPLIFSVSTMPFIEMDFHPDWLIFEQNGKKWSPNNYPESIDMFPLDENVPFGGQITETQLHQGVIMLPGWFDVYQPIKINYKNFRKVCHLK